MTKAEIMMHLKTVQSLLVIGRTAVLGQTFEKTGLVGETAWADLFEIISDEVSDVVVGLEEEGIEPIK